MNQGIIQLISIGFFFLFSTGYGRDDNWCPAGWILRGDACYYVDPISKTWQQSRIDCQRHGADLAVIRDAEENQFFASLSGGPKWIGLSDIAEEGKWVWIDGTELTSDKSHWGDGEPNDHENTNEDCVHEWFGAGLWNDRPCDYPTQSVCKLEKGGRTTRRKTNCTSNYMEIKMSRNTLNASKYESITLIDSTCRATISSTYITLGTSTASCGTTKTENQTHIVYTNQVVLKTKNSGGTIITRDHDDSITFSCAYAKDGYASGASFVPIRKVAANESGIGSFTFELDMFKSNGYIESYSFYPVQLELKDDAYFQIKANVEDTDYVVLINQCYSTPSMNKNDNRKYIFINNRCSTDNTVKFYTANYQRQRFSIETYRYMNRYTVAYIHCLVFLCKKTSTDSRCTSGCNGNNVNRARREISGGEQKLFSKDYMLEAGPILFAANSGSTEKQEKQNALKTTVIVLVVGVVALCVILALFISKLRRRRNVNGNNVTGEIGVDNAPSGKTYVINDESVEEKSEI